MMEQTGQISQQACQTLLGYLHKVMFLSGLFPHAYQVLVDNAIAGSKEGEDVRNEVLLLGLQGLPVLDVFGKVHLKHCRKKGCKR